MFDHESRYYPLENALWTYPDGETIAYKRRRLLPRPEGMPELAWWKVEAGDRFDLVAARTLGDSQSYWRIADANRALDPLELETPGRTLVIPMPQPGEAGLQP
jgi:hypothetical protein